MSFVGFLFKKKFYLHLGLSVLLTIILFFLALQFIKVYTDHGDTYILPDLTGKTIADIENENYHKIYEFVVIDSIYDNQNPKGSVVIQNPPAGSMVKKHRKVYVTTVAFSVERVEMPDLIDLSLRQAVNTLRSKGLEVNSLQYVEDFAGNAVLEQLFDDEVIEPGTIIEKGAAIDLVVGLGRGHYVPVPFLAGLTFREAKDAINIASFNLGTVYYLDEEDARHARVYRQNPAWSDNALSFKGNTIDISLRSDLYFDFQALIDRLRPDTLNVIDTTSRVLPEF